MFSLWNDVSRWRNTILFGARLRGAWLRVIEKNARYGNRSVLNLKQKFHTCKRTFEKKITGFRNDVNRVCESTRYLTPCNCKKNGTGLLFVRILLVYTLIIVPMKRNASGMTSTDVKVQHGKVLSCVWWEENLKSTRALKSYDADVGGCCGVPPCSLWAAPLVFLSALAAIARSDDRRWLADPRRSQSRIIDRLSRSPTLKWKKKRDSAEGINLKHGKIFPYHYNLLKGRQLLYIETIGIDIKKCCIFMANWANSGVCRWNRHCQNWKDAPTVENL